MSLILSLIGILHVANGVAMLAAPADWYALVPGVTETGPANIHFIRDIGLAFAAAGTGLWIGARREAGAAVLVAPAIFLAGHAGLHVVEMIVHHAAPAQAFRDLALVGVPGFLPLYALWQRRHHERSIA